MDSSTTRKWRTMIIIEEVISDEYLLISIPGYSSERKEIWKYDIPAHLHRFIESDGRTYFYARANIGAETIDDIVIDNDTWEYQLPNNNLLNLEVGT